MAPRRVFRKLEATGIGRGSACPGWGLDSLVLVVALAPIVVATARAVHRGWLPVGDNGLMYIRSVDVFSRHPPLLGMWSFGSVSARSLYNHPGPLLYDLFAVPTKLFGLQGVAIVSALVNAAAFIGIAFVGRRLGGPLLATIAVAGSTIVCWSMGSQLLFDPWTPNSLLLPFLLFLMLIWAASNGDLLALPVAVGVGSVLLESTLSFGLLVPALCAWAVFCLWLRLRRQRAENADAWPALRRRATGSGRGHLRRVPCLLGPAGDRAVLSAGAGQPRPHRPRSTHDQEHTRVPQGDPACRRAWAVPPWWLRPSMVRVYWVLPSLMLALLCLAVPAVLLAWIAFDACRRRDRVVGSAVATAAVSVVLTLITVSRSPVYGSNVQPYETRFLWPVAGFLSIVVVTGLVHRLVSVRIARPTLGLIALVAMLFTALNLPASSGANRTHAPDWTIPAMADLDHQIGSLTHEGTLLVHFDQHEQRWYSFFIRFARRATPPKRSVRGR